MRFDWLVLPLVCGAKCPRYSQNKRGDAIRILTTNSCGVVMPHRFRASTDDIQGHLELYRKEIEEPRLVPSLKGFEETRMSGSSQFCLGARELFEFLKGQQATVIDLRMESHGFIDDLAVSFYCPYNWDRLRGRPSEMWKEEVKDFQELAQKGKVILYEKEHDKEGAICGGGKTVHFNTAYTEAQALQKEGIKYVRIFVPDHRRPRDREVDQLVDLFARNHWLHFHCKAGRGRTTTAMIMRDMVMNARDIALDDILMRNFIYSTLDLSKFDGELVKRQYAEERLDFLGSFYNYCLERVPGLSWSCYLRGRTNLLQGRMVRSLQWLHTMMTISTPTEALVEFSDRE
jgi:hypothetical protein